MDNTSLVVENVAPSLDSVEAFCFFLGLVVVYGISSEIVLTPFWWRFSF